MFYRIATIDDFEKAEKEFTDIPNHIKALIIEDTCNIPKACKELREIYWYGLKDAKARCDSYLSYLTARSDFYQGQTIYTEY